MIRIDDMDVLIRTVNGLPNHFMFRGQANAAWRLEPTLERVIGASWSAENAKRFEDYSLDQFKSKFHLYDKENEQPHSKLGWLSVMQHYGVPTRLLDFTESPYIALYFALESYTPSANNDLALYAVDYTSLMNKSISFICAMDAEFRENRESVYRKQDKIFEEVVDRFAYDIVWVAEPGQLNARLDRQSGSFLLSGNRGKKIEDLLFSNPYSADDVIKYVIDKSLYPSIFALLRKMNITSKSLFGDLDGLAQSIRMQLQIYSLPNSAP